MPSYLFTSARLGFRNWRAEDLPLMAAINADAAVMQYFPATQTLEQTEAFILRMQIQLAEKGYCYYAVDGLEDGAFIGFIGLFYQLFQSPYTPSVDIGWRLATHAWQKGYATEGARRCLQYAREDLGIEKIYAFAPAVNTPSIHVMQKIGMQLQGTFNHPALLNDDRLRECVAYKTGR